jgi:methionyl-tRNA formyltransferase
VSILVLAAKDVGLRCLKYLVNNKYNFELVTSEENNEILEYAKINKIAYKFFEEDLVLEKKYDWLLNLWSSFILKKHFLDNFLHRVNIHPSLSPYCLGNDNAAWTIRNRCKAGVSLLEMKEKVDEGDIWVQKEIEYTYPIKGKELHAVLLEESVNIFCNNWNDIYDKKIKLKKFEGIKTKYTRTDTNKDREIIIGKENEIFINKLLSHDFSPVNQAFIYLENKKYKVSLNIEEVVE